MGEVAIKPQNRKVVFAILAHDYEDVLASQIHNIRHFNNDAEIVLFNGGKNKRFGVNMGIPICPYSRPLKYEFLGNFLFDVARWLEEIDVKYEYLVNLDHDILFVKSGFSSFLDETMAGFDCMGWALTVSHDPSEFSVFSSKAVPRMWKEWGRWQSFFELNHFLWVFNPGQVYRRSIVQKILSRINRPVLEKLLSSTTVTAMEEMLFVTMARACGANIRGYPDDGLGAIGWGMDEIPWHKVELAKLHPYYYWIHPIKGRNLIETAQRLRELDLQANPFEVRGDGCYQIINRQSGKALEVIGESIDGGAEIIQWSNGNKAHQQWKIADAGAGWYHIINRRSGLVLEVKGQSVDPGAEAIQWWNTGGHNQQWYISDSGSGYYLIVNRHSLKALDVTGQAEYDGAPVIQWDLHGRPNQQWSIIPVE
ncbi:RICIN domain-containing protein [Paenibacillus thermotolerans]|uniref:RICIN domain-containing protein n=1 Tax=Paenibacillus thermotolerans TaxID=3027807 RepID=UPI0023681E0B|nr:MULTISPECIES: RICIN domain-containing protein [unclassified Paenibacillus]